MEAAKAHPRISALLTPFQSGAETVKCTVPHRAVFTTPQILLTFQGNVFLKPLSKSKSMPTQTWAGSQFSNSQMQVLADEFELQTLARERRGSTDAVDVKALDDTEVLLLGKPWERLEELRLRELSSANKEARVKLKDKHLEELSNFLQQRRDEMMWLLDDDIQKTEGHLVNEEESHRYQDQVKPPSRADDATQFLVDRLSATNLSLTDWKFSKMMKQSGMRFTESELLKIVGGLGANGQWKHALSVVEWVYTSYRRHKYDKSRFVYTKLLAVMGKARRPDEALRIFNLMREDYYIYPDMPAYHCIAVTLGQAGMLRPLLTIIESMKRKPSRKTKNAPCRKWDPSREPDVVVFNAVLNACVSLQHWKAVFWVFEQMRKTALKPNGPTFGLAMEVMFHSGKYEFVRLFFQKCQRSGEALKSLTYRTLVRTYWKEGKIDAAVGAVRDMEQRGVIGTSSVYYELARCLCYHGRWQQAMVEVEKLVSLPLSDGLEITFTGMVHSAMDGGHIDDCICIFRHMKHYCHPTIETINAMLKAYSKHDMFSKAKELFNETKRAITGSEKGKMLPDYHTYGIMLEACARAHQWECFVYVYKEMILAGYELDQTKQASLLVEASRAGKLHLLQHAFDSIVEAGQIPSPSFFTELAFQALAQEDFQRAITIIRAMSYSHLQVTKDEWRMLFWNHRDRISRNCLQKLLGFVYKLEMAECDDATMGNLLSSLQSANKSHQKSHRKSHHLHVLKECFGDDDLGIVWSTGGYIGEDEDIECEVGEVGELPSAYEILAAWKEKRLVQK